MKKLLIILCLFLYSVPGWAESLYCFSSASPGGNGSLSTPWNSLADIVWGSGAGEVGPGDTLYLDGTFNDDYTTITAGGTIGNIITVTAYDQNNPPELNKLQNIDSDPENWTEVASGCWRLDGVTSAPYVLLEDNKALGYGYGSATVNYTTTDCSDFGTGDYWYYDGTNDKLYYKPTDGTFDTETITGYGYRAFNISDGVDYITFSHLRFKQMSRALHFPGSTAQLDTITVEKCDFENVKTAIYVINNTGYTANDIIIRDCTYDYVSMGAMVAPSGYAPAQITSVAITDSIFTHGGIVTADSTEEWYYATCRYVLNTSCNGLDDPFDCCTGSGTGCNSYNCLPSGYLDQEQISVANAKDVVITGNYISGKTRGIVLNNQNAQDPGGVDTYNIDISHNTLEGVTYTGITFTGEAADLGDYGDIHVYSNLFIDCGNGIGVDKGLYSGGTPANHQRGAINAAYGGHADSMELSPFIIANNTFYNNYRGIMFYGHTADNIIFKNNISYGSEFVHAEQYSTDIADQTGLDINYNLYYPVANTLCTALDVPWGCCTGEGTGGCDELFIQGSNEATKRTWSYWTGTAPTWDANGLVTDPLLTSVYKPTTITVGNGGIDNGISGWTDFLGRPPIGGFPIGAYELYYAVGTYSVDGVNITYDVNGATAK